MSTHTQASSWSSLQGPDRRKGLLKNGTTSALRLLGSCPDSLPGCSWPLGGSRGQTCRQSVPLTYIDEVRPVLTGHPKSKVSPKSSLLLYHLQGEHCHLRGEDRVGRGREQSHTSVSTVQQGAQPTRREAAPRPPVGNADGSESLRMVRDTLNSRVPKWAL